MTAVKEDILDRAIAGRLIGSLSSAIDPVPWQVQSGSLEKRGPLSREGLCLTPSGEIYKHSLNPTITTGCAVELSIALGHERFAAQSLILKRDRHFWLTEELMFSCGFLQAALIEL